MKLSYQNQLIIAAALVVVLAVVVIVLLIAPQFSTLADLDARIEEAKIGESQAQALLTQRQEIKARSAQTEATRLRLANQIPETPELPSLIIELQDTINAAGLEFSSLAPSPPALNEAGYSSINVAINVGGTWQDTVDLLQRLRSITRQVRILSFSVTRVAPLSDDEADNDEPNQVETSLQIQVYTMPAQVAAPAAVPAPDETQ